MSRELARNRNTAVARYDVTQAASACRLRRLRCVRLRKLAEGSTLYRHVHDRLVYWRWSPQQIAARLRAMHPDAPNCRVSHGTIYAAIYTHGRRCLNPAMIEALRQEKPTRGRRRTTLAGGSFVPEALRIQYRPEEIKQPLLPGHWAGDFIKGACGATVQKLSTGDHVLTMPKCASTRLTKIQAWAKYAHRNQRHDKSLHSQPQSRLFL